MTASGWSGSTSGASRSSRSFSARATQGASSSWLTRSASRTSRTGAGSRWRRWSRRSRGSCLSACGRSRTQASPTATSSPRTSSSAPRSASFSSTLAPPPAWARSARLGLVCRLPWHCWRVVSSFSFLVSCAAFFSSAATAGSDHVGVCVCVRARGGQAPYVGYDYNMAPCDADYCPPERFIDEAEWNKYDVYSCALVLLRVLMKPLLTGQQYRTFRDTLFSVDNDLDHFFSFLILSDPAVQAIRSVACCISEI
eukprot:2639658-Rhodomonas_salina.1